MLRVGEVFFQSELRSALTFPIGVAVAPRSRGYRRREKLWRTRTLLGTLAGLMGVDERAGISFTDAAGPVWRLLR